MNLGAGRKKLSDIIDPSVGIRVHIKTGDIVKSGQTLFTVYCRDKSEIMIDELLKSVRFEAVE
jgi:thymidine phosphorylase